MATATIVCQSCGCAHDVPFKKRRQKYCSRRCVWIGTKGREFNARISRVTAKTRADALRGRGQGKTYRKREGRHEHRVIAEAMLGRPLNGSEVVHHRDGDKRNNDPENLAVLLGQGDHMREHGLGIKGMPLAWKPWEARWGKR